MTAPLVLCGTIAFPSLVLAAFTSGPIAIGFFVLAVVVVAFAIFWYGYFALNDPNRLQTESYQLQRHALDMIEMQGGEIPLEPTSLVALTNPALPMLGSGAEGAAS